MDAPAVRHLTVPEFLAWAEAQETGRYELVRGEIVAMAPERLEHVHAKRLIANALDAAIGRAGVRCQAFVDGLGVAIDDQTTYIPDALVNCGDPAARDAMIAPNPVIVVEVLSPSTRNIDKAAKLSDYFRVPGLRHYLIVDLGRHLILHYARQADGTILVTIVKDGELVFDPPGISVPAASFWGVKANAAHNILQQ
jgi:Uma2 family endonuclease